MRKDTISTIVSTSACTVQDSSEKIIYVEFNEGDVRNPVNYSRSKKLAITLSACIFAATTSAAASSYTISTSSMIKELKCSEIEAALGLGLYAVGFGVTPLITSSFSEEVGRRPAYIFSSIVYTLTQVMVALAPNIQTVIVGRVLGGISGSTGASLVGGTIADIWLPHERGLPMAFFAFSSLFSFGMGSIIGGVIVSQPHMGWRWVQWIHAIMSAMYAILVLVVMSETRGSILLKRLARDARRVTGDDTIKARIEVERESLLSLIKIACTRPLYFLLTEPLVQSFSLWAGFTWGVMYCLLEAASPMFRSVYGFTVRQTGFMYGALSVGAALGLLGNLYQDKLYIRRYAQRKQEARLYSACVAAILLPIGMFVVAWTSTPSIPWIVPVMGLTVFMTGVSVNFQVAFLYLADCYNTYASSAQAGQSLSRNLLALVFPVLSPRMFATLGYKWGLTLFGLLAVLMAPTPFVLFAYGSRIRVRSIASRSILAVDSQSHGEVTGDKEDRV
ncbi:major facilitator superfamily domain-containing protein [Scleroderma citrinum]